MRLRHDGGVGTEGGATVRRATATAIDVDALVRLHLDTVLVAYRRYFPPDAPPPDADVLRRLWAHDVATAHAVLVAEEEGRVVGSVVARANGDLARLHVHPARWRRGTGRRLHDAAVDVLRAGGAGRAGLWVIAANRPARALYEGAGWQLDPSAVLTELGVTEVRYVLDLTHR